jgi:hypothetical protein
VGRRRQRRDADARHRRRGIAGWSRAVAAVLPALATFAAGVDPALASRQQLAMFQDDAALLSQPEATLDTFRQLGVGVIRLRLAWAQIAPQPWSSRRPATFDAANPAAYPASSWSIYDRIVRGAVARGMQVDLTVTSPAPLWSNGPGAPPLPPGQSKSSPPEYGVGQWKPSTREYAAFVRALGIRYSGRFTPAGASSPLPRVGFWALWNEPNFGFDLAPQAASGSATLTAPLLYRSLLDAGWGALHATGHAGDTILIGSLAARGSTRRPTRGNPEGLPGRFGMTKPVQFIRALYCVDSRYRQLRGAAARAIGCPASAAASRDFRRAHPGLFAATGFADHPYPINLPPTRLSEHDADYTQFVQLPRLAAALDRVQRAYGSATRFPLYVTEYGYITNPPNNSVNHFASPRTAAYYINWAEYLSWRNPRIATTMQYLLMDPNPRANVPEYGGFASGLELYGGVHKPSFDTYRLPLFLPVTATSPGATLELWGAVRPAHYAALDSGLEQRVQIQFAPDSGGGFAPIATVPVIDPRGYFDVRVAFPTSGFVRLAWSYPMGGPTVFSRTQWITVG